MNIAEKLKAPFPEDKIHWRIGARTADKTKGIALAYIDARDVMQRLDDVVGPLNWQCRYSHVTQKGVICEIGILIDGDWLWRANGAGDTQVEAEKGAMSDAFKRAGVMWGIGRYLYSLPNNWVQLKNNGKELAVLPQLPAWAKPSRINKKQMQESVKQALDMCAAGDSLGLRQLWDELEPHEVEFIWPQFDTAQKSTIKKLLHEAKEAA